MTSPPLAAVGTLNEGKLVCVSDALAAMGFEFELQAVETTSGVSDQPLGHEETVRGARNRANDALAAVEGALLGFGIESGVLMLDGQTLDFCACAIALHEGGGAQPLGLSSAWVLPAPVALAVMVMGSGGGYNGAFQAMGIDPNPTGGGVLAELSGGALSRPKQMGEAVTAALLQIRNPRMYAIALSAAAKKGVFPVDASPSGRRGATSTD